MAKIKFDNDAIIPVMSLIGIIYFLRIKSINDWKFEQIDKIAKQSKESEKA